MNIVLTQDFFPKIGGAHLWLYEVYKRWPSPVNVMTQDYSLDPARSDQQAEFDSLDHGMLKIIRRDIRIDDINLFSLNCVKQYMYILRCIKEIACNKLITLHCIRVFPEGIAAALFKLLFAKKCRVVVYAHGEEILAAKTSCQLTIFAKIVYSLTDLIIANSNFTKILVKEISSSARVVTIHPGVDVKAFNVSYDAQQACRSNLGWPKDTTIVTTIARLEPHKNHASVIRALAQLHREGLSIGYVIVGEGSERENLVKLSQSLGMRKWVSFVGQVSDEEKKIILAASDIHILPTIWGESIEGFGIAFLEAAAAKIPSISGNIGGQPEAVLHGETGLVVDATSLKELKDAIRCLFLDKDLRKRLGHQGHLWAQQNDWQVVTEKTLRVIQENLRL
ncbi:glycosyltransferase family 4 protein [Desulfovulcanus sp.]